MAISFKDIFLALGIVILCWFSLYFFYIELIALPYFRKYVGINKKLAELETIDRIKLIFYRRYQSYNVAAYFILLLSTFLLLACILIFIYANELVFSSAVVQKTTNSPLTTDTTFLLATSISIRIGIVFIAFFIAQTLLKLYKYNLHMASFYTTLFDSLISHKELNMSIPQLLEIIKPTNILNEDAKVPHEELLEILKNLTEIASKKS